METKPPKKILTEDEKLFIINNFKDMSASKLAKELNGLKLYEHPFTGPIIYSIVNSIRIDLTKEIKRLRGSGNDEKADKMAALLTIVLPNKKQRVYRNIESIVDKLFV